jgi:hypothetical protein
MPITGTPSSSFDAPALSGELQARVTAASAKLDRGESGAVLESLSALTDLVKGHHESFLPVLGALSLRGAPYTLQRHFVMEPLFRLRMPRRQLWKCARQISKSTSLSARGVLQSAAYGHLRTLFVTPRFEQVRRLSTLYVKPLINESPLSAFFVDNDCVQAVLQRSFTNGSALYFSFAFLDCDRVRGISSDVVFMDETQDIDYDFVPIIHECMAASDVGLSLYSGTPKTLDNGIQAMWEDSSQAEWVTPCSCGKWNMASIHAELMKMIGRETVVCAYCGKPLNPREGHWHHTNAQAGSRFMGYHVPQVIMPMHYEYPEKWGELLAKRDGRVLGYTPAKFLNEVLGESADLGVKLITITDIRKASQLGPNDFNRAVDKIRQGRVRVLAVDWGGGGADEISFTTIALVSWHPITGNYECHYCERFHTGYAHDEEARKLLFYFREAGCHYFAHDYGGAGSVRETLMIQAGLPMENILGFTYTRATARHMVVYKAPPEGEARGFYSLDKARSLVLQAICLKSGVILLPEYESSKNVTHDLLSLMEDKHEMPKGSDIYLIRRHPKLPDDFAHALNYGCVAIWHTQQSYPDLSAIQGIKLSQEQMNFANPPGYIDPSNE